MNAKFTLIHEEKANDTIGLMARLLKVSRAGYYAWVNRQGSVSPTKEHRILLKAAIVQIYTDKKQT